MAMTFPCDCGVEVPESATACAGCGRPAVVDVRLDAPVPDARRRYRVARAMAGVVPGVPAFASLQQALATTGIIARGLSRADGQRVLDALAGLGETASAEPGTADPQGEADSTRPRRTARGVGPVLLGAGLLVLVALVVGAGVVRVLTRRPLPVRPVAASPLPEFPGDPQSALDRMRALRELLRKHDYPALASRLEPVVRAESQSSIHEYDAQYALAFADGVPDLERHLDAWVAAEPRSHVAFAARALYNRGAGFDARGKALARDTTDGQFEQMVAQHQRAVEDCRSALALQPQFVTCHVLFVEVARMGATDPVEGVYRRGLEVVPWSLSLREQFLASLTPRWGGSYEAMDAFAEREIRQSLGDADYLRLRGRAATDRADVLLRNEDYRGALRVADETIAKSGPTSGLHWIRGHAHEGLKDWAAARAAFDDAASLSRSWYPGSQAVNGLVCRGEARWMLGDQTGAAADFRIALAFTPDHEKARTWEDYLRKRRAW